MVELEEAADRVLDRLRDGRHGQVIAVWQDGSLTTEGFAFWARQTDSGPVRPVMEFVVTGKLPPRLAVIQRLGRAFGSR